MQANEHETEVMMLTASARRLATLTSAQAPESDDVPTLQRAVVHLAARAVRCRQTLLARNSTAYYAALDEAETALLWTGCEVAK